MKKIIIIIASMFLVGISANTFAQKNTTRKLNIIDQSNNPVRHWHLYVFETEDKQPMDLVALRKNLTAVKGVLKVDPSNVTANPRALVFLDEKTMISKSEDLKNAFKSSGFEITNIPTNEK